MDMNSTSTPSHQMQGGVVVMVDMILGLLSVVTNIVVITAIRRETTERDNWNMFKLILIHLCISNLVSAVLVTLTSLHLRRGRRSNFQFESHLHFLVAVMTTKKRLSSHH